MTALEKLHAAFPWSDKWGVGKTTRELILYLHVCRGYPKSAIAQIAGISMPHLLRILDKNHCNYEPIKNLILDKMTAVSYHDALRLSIPGLRLKYGLTEDEVKHGRTRRNIRRS